MSTRAKRYLHLGIIAVLLIATLVLVLDRWVFPLPPEKLARPTAQFVYSREGRLLSSFASRDQYWRLPVTVGELSPRLIASVMSLEDRRFRYHFGIDPLALTAAAVADIKAGAFVRGGSTITMQIARMMEPKERTLLSKLLEMLRALQLETHYSKDELVEIYFNLVPYGGNIEGVGAATHFYFDKQPGDLSWSEAAILTAIPASPNTFRPDLHSEQCRARRDMILGVLHEQGILSADEYRSALDEEIPVRRFERPFVAPHFCQSIIAANRSTPALHTTLDFGVQLLCERLAKLYHGTLAPKGIHNLSVVVLDNRSGELLGSVGSPDFTDARHQGQINGVRARRSPGSALKPFVYALGFDDGRITPASRVDDIPVSYGGYSPENYDEKYHGVVAVSEALVQSFNVPAVNLTAEVGLRRFADLLRRGGITSLNRRYYDYGLPLVLGACEVSLLELCNLYATLARGGEFRPVQQLKADSAATGSRLISAGAAYLVSDILAGLQRPDLPSSWEFTADRPKIAWKTGTSYGRKDAWTIGYNPVYTVGVWTGNFSGEGSPYLVGAEAAAPFMFEVFDELMREAEPIWFERPSTIGVREVCAVSGLPPNDDCPLTRPDLYIENVSPVVRCDVHRRLLVDRHTGYLLCRACAWGATVDTVTIEQWPARLTGWLLGQNAVTALPEHNPACRGVIADERPVIASPEADAIYRMRPQAPREYQNILFEASVSHDCRKVHWFLDDRLFATAETGRGVFYRPEPGIHKLMAVDDFGRSTTVRFEVR